ncbi:metallophosphoesterase [Kitasatospora cineracea]|uniref:2',3'-cyclic-nucleotide 2'-phosphodiesterase (5'-nucleotidase family) n=1 Tax=Kitasatospora cineracea TaxID=88074 RepID=A0A8G1UMA4_9ACTN|nr:metallophosphoesterase [Kitasatospora cineracea]ROR46483.1 2',3'-cyclic-nucleotide 2'-phosphodiesterase (5'-nucleotidase family) [Kitasatospora cineracea]
MTPPTRTLRQIIATTDIHSSLAGSTGMLAHLHAAREGALVVDCGDFFEGTGIYRLGQGRVERRVLLSLFDVIAPGNHGWSHHFEPGLRELTVCANAVDSETGELLFRPLQKAEVGGRRVAVTAVIGEQAFSAIPLGDRVGQRATDPVRALRDLLIAHHHEVDSWVVLSHSGFEHDLRLVDECPFLDVVFAGHCHSDRYGPEQVGTTLIVKGAELGAGYALAEPAGVGWAARTGCFPQSAPLPAELEPIGEQIEALAAELAIPLGRLADRWRNVVPDRRELLEAIAVRLRTELGAEAVILNETVLRETPLGDELCLADLLSVEPCGNRLVHVPLPEDADPDLPALLPVLAERAGPLVTVPDPLPPGVRAVLTTDYLAEGFPAGPAHRLGHPLGLAVRHTLTDTPFDEGAVS